MRTKAMSKPNPYDWPFKEKKLYSAQTKQAPRNQYEKRKILKGRHKIYRGERRAFIL